MRELWLFTRKYPEGPGETFLDHAMPVWAEVFRQVVVVPMFRGAGGASLPKGVELLRPWDRDHEHAAIGAGATVMRAGEVLRSVSAHGGSSAFAERLSHARQLLWKADILRRDLMPRYDPSRVALLTAWMEDWTNVLALEKRRDPRIRFASLAHGSDLYVDRRPDGVMPHRAMQMEAVDRVCCISEHGARYLREQWPDMAGKVVATHLGTTDHGLAPWQPDDVLRIASCAYLRKPKRIGLIAQALQQVKRRVHWTHFGDGPDRAELDTLVRLLPQNIKVDLKGDVDQRALTDWYQTHPLDLLLHLSGHEGVPLALMEASSFGIPIWANDVGGVSEVLRPEAGLLLPAAIGAEALAALLDSDAPAAWCDKGRRDGVRAHWKAHFDARRNFRHLAEMLP